MSDIFTAYGKICSSVRFAADWYTYAEAHTPMEATRAGQMAATLMKLPDGDYDIAVSIDVTIYAKEPRFCGVELPHGPHVDANEDQVWERCEGYEQPPLQSPESTTDDGPSEQQQPEATPASTTEG